MSKKLQQLVDELGSVEVLRRLHKFLESTDEDIFDHELYSDEQVDQELIAAGYDPDEVAEWGLKLVQSLLATRGTLKKEQDVEDAVEK